MLLFEYLDEQYKVDRKRYGIQHENKEFRSYLPIFPLDFNAENRFICVKGYKKTKVLFTPDGTRQYFSDADIISILRNHGNDSTVCAIVDKLIQLYLGKNAKFSFCLNNQAFEGYGISFFDIEDTFFLNTDSTMSLNELVFLINMILEKDRSYGQAIHADTLKHTLCKYVSLIKYYRWHDESSANFLKEIGYPLNKPLEQLFINGKSSTKLSHLFTRIEDFEKIGVI